MIDESEAVDVPQPAAPERAVSSVDDTRIVRRFWLNFAFAFVALFALFMAWGMSSPLFSSPDEPAHLITGSAIVHGDIGVSAIKIPEWVVEATKGTCFVASPDQPASCQKLQEPADTSTVDFGTPYSTYNPLYYVLTAWPGLIWNGEFAFHAMDLMSALLNALMLAAAFAVARTSTKSAWVPIAVVSTLSPLTLFMGGQYNPSSFEATTATLAWVGLAAAFQAYRSNRSVSAQRLFTAAAAIGMSLLIPTRLLSPVWALLILLLVLFVTRLSPRQFWGFVTRRFNLAAIGLILVSTIYSVWWAYSHPAVSTSGAESITTGVYQTLRGSLIDMGTFAWPSGFGSLGWLDTLVSWAAYFFTAMWIALVAIALVRNRSRRRRFVLLAAIILTVLVPAAFEGFFWNGDGWQGRYTTPFAVGIPLLAGYVISRQRETDYAWRRAVGGRWIPIAWGFINLLAFGINYHRYAIGENKAWNPHKYTWEPNVLGGNFWLVLEILATLAVVIWAMLAYNRNRRGALPTDD